MRYIYEMIKLNNQLANLFQVELRDEKYAADKDLDEIFHSIGKYVTYKMVNDMKEILDQQNGKKDE